MTWDLLYRLSEDQLNAREELAKMLSGLQKDIRAHDDSVANILGSVVCDLFSHFQLSTSNYVSV